MSKPESRRLPFLRIAAFLGLALISLINGCLPAGTDPLTTPGNPPPPSLPVSTFTTQPSTPTASSSQTPGIPVSPAGYGLFTVVGLEPLATLPIYQEPSLSAVVRGQIPFAGKSLLSDGTPIEADGTTWLQIDYQGITGWVEQFYLAEQRGDLPHELVALAHTAAAALKDTDYSRLGKMVHPDLCLRFSPYPYLRESDLVFCPSSLPELLASNDVYIWGTFDGSGEPIELSFGDYHQRFVYDQDFFQPGVIGLNQEVGLGNALNNIPDRYPDGKIVEYHFPGFDPQYGGMDWRSLRLVFIQEQGTWYLVALVHGEWTI